MEEFNYERLYSQALQLIKQYRNPTAKNVDVNNFKWDEVIQEELFDFGNHEINHYLKVTNYAKEISISCLNAMIGFMSQYYKKSLEPLDEGILMTLGNPCFAYVDKSTQILYLFRKVEESSFWKSDCEPENILKYMSANSIDSCRYIYLMKDKSYLQVIGHNSNVDDPGRGTNVYSLTDFVAFVFGKDVKEKFLTALIDYTTQVNNCLGYIFLKSLTPDALISFRKVTENRILNFEYDKLLCKNIGYYKLDVKDFPILRKQFFDNHYYLLMLGDSDFAESIITAEWLYDSMIRAKAIDLTVIGMGYFKAIEQLLFNIIKLQSKKELDEAEFTLGSIATYYKKHINTIFRSDIQYYTKTYIKEAIFSYAELRNGYFHKHNICNEEKIREIRTATFDLFFLILSAHEFSVEERNNLGIPDITLFDDFYRLCEYVNFHADDFFIISSKGREILCNACKDTYIQLVDDRFFRYSGVYMQVIDERAQRIRITKEYVPERIFLAKVIEADRKVRMNVTKIKTIFENGRYVGPSLAEENEVLY